MSKSRTFPVLVILAIALVLGGAVIVNTKIRAGISASFDDSSRVSTYVSSCDYLEYVIEQDMSWPETEEEFFAGMTTAMQKGIIVDTGAFLPDFIEFNGYPIWNSEGLDVCSDQFPVQSLRLTCDEARIYGGDKLLEVIKAHRKYFHRLTESDDP